MKKINNIRILLAASLSILPILISCNKDDKADVTTPDNYLTEITGSTSYTQAEFCDYLAKYFDRISSATAGAENGFGLLLNSISGIGNISKPVFKKILAERCAEMDCIFKKENGLSTSNSNWHIESYVFKYRSKSYRGEDIELSGIVTFPVSNCNDMTVLSSYSLYSHYVQSSDNESSSRIGNIMQARALFNSAVIIADFEGYGCSNDRNHSGSIFNVLARQEVDCAMAAIELMKQHGAVLSDNGHSDSFGYSLGAPTAVAVQRYIENYAPDNVASELRFRSTYAGGGPFVVSEMLRYFNENRDYDCVLSRDCTNGLYVIPESELGGYKPEDFWIHHELGSADNATAVRFNSIYAADMLTSDGLLNEKNPKVRIIFNMADKYSDSRGWTPKHPIFLTHERNDDKMPYICLEKLYNDLKYREDGSINTNVYCHLTDHWPFQTNVIHFAETIIAVLNMMLHESPAEVYESIR